MIFIFIKMYEILENFENFHIFNVPRLFKIVPFVVNIFVINIQFQCYERNQCYIE